MAVGIFLFLIIGPLVPIVLLAIQFIFVFCSNKIIARSADWHITEKNHFIHILQYPLLQEWIIQQPRNYQKKMCRD